jgi:DNA-directed RNA polymerase specialized sigma24 family protein
MKTLLETVLKIGETKASQAEKDALQKAVELLPVDQQLVLSLYFEKRQAVADISTKLGCSVTTTYTKINRALITLRHQFNPSYYRKMYEILYPCSGKPSALK